MYTHTTGLHIPDLLQRIKFTVPEVTMDLITHLLHVFSGYDSVCTIVDQFLKYVYFVPCAEMVYT